MRFLFGLALSLFLLRPAAADEAIPMSVPELAQKADLIVHGKIVSKRVQRDAEGRIFTEVGLAVQDVWKGDPKKPLLTVVHGGGVLGEEKVAVSGQVVYDLGEEVVGFFVWNQRGEAVTLSMSQGKFHVNRKSDSTAEVANPYHGKKDAPLTFDSLKSRVKETAK